ncbi:hypothetical protein [Secundilactobacillus malefermentans]|uniref:D-alanyl-D-alanine carboxypeptidase n=1 Tax=Secundilactobacillus malefermentans TaxID=176292 RepID=A0A4R5NIM1_9LACO|nr:hypothetical protein [Secundilactobacillus malefermentans]QEA31503.1 hypothetical protein FGL90_04535 [Secundilactobacillus malefermentans]TDG74397.1 hypothetical protein C5L31_000044 [Secundilactobacillus malefermentans]
MKKRLIITLGICFGLFGLGGALVAQPHQAQAKTTYTKVSAKYGIFDTTYYVKSSKKSVYMWNASHTKKIINLKNYPSQTFVKLSELVLKHGNTKAVYYRTSTALRGNGKIVTGYVWRGNLKAGVNPNPNKLNYAALSQFNSTKTYASYIQKGNYQKLAKSVVKLFPKTPVDLNLSRIAAYNESLSTFDEGTTWFEDQTSVTTTGYTDIIPLNSAMNTLYKHKTASNAKKLAYLQTALNKAGYSASKRAKLSGYKLGIYFINNIPDTYRSIIEDGGNGRAAGYALVLAKRNSETPDVHFITE